MRSRRPLYTHNELLPLIRPRSVAVVGASRTKANFGTLAIEHLGAGGFDGHVYAVHPEAESGAQLAGAPLVTSLGAIDGGVDCVLVAVPARGVETVISEAAEAGCRAAIVFSAGFGETGAEGGDAQQRIRHLADRYGIRVGGPNTLGIINYRDGIPLTFVSDLAMELPAGRIGIVSQSGGLATHLGHVRHRGIGLSHMITCGNSVDVHALDYVNFLIDDDGTDVVVLAVEGMDDPAGFTEVGMNARAAGKPIVMIKSGRTELGGQAAISHTGSLVGNHAVFLAAADQAGIHVIDNTEELLETAVLFGKWAGLRCNPGGVAVVTTMGGPGVIAADAAVDAGLSLPAPGPVTATRLRDLVPAFATTGNPIDTTSAPADPVLTEVITCIGQDPAYAATVILAASTTGPATSGRPAAIASAGRMDFPLAAVWLSSWSQGPGSEMLDSDPRVPLFRSSDRCMRAIARWMRWHEITPTSAHSQHALNGEQLQAVRLLMGKLAPDSHGALDEAWSRELLALAGLEVPRAAVARSSGAAVRAAEDLGYPVVAKVISADVPHKAAAGGVLLDLRSGQQVADAYERVTDAVSRAHPRAVVDGVLVVESLDTSVELMCGLVRDPVFGAVVVCGAGGAAVELINDVAHVVAPVSEAHARTAIGGLRIMRRLRSADPVTAGRVETGLALAMVRLAALADAVPEIVEVDANPVVVRDDGAPVALDALVVLAAEATSGVVI